jgi:hypothetical protein
MVLSQSRAALLASAPVYIIAQIFGTGRTSPIHAGKADKCRDDHDLGRKEGALGKRSEQVGSLIHYGGKQYEKQRRRDGDELSILARSELAHDPVPVFWLHLFPSL